MVIHLNKGYFNDYTAKWKTTIAQVCGLLYFSDFMYYDSYPWLSHNIYSHMLNVPTFKRTRSYFAIF